MKSAKLKNTDEIIPGSNDTDALPAKQELALQAVISHATLKEASLVAGVSETTLWRYMCRIRRFPEGYGKPAVTLWITPSPAFRGLRAMR